VKSVISQFTFRKHLSANMLLLLIGHELSAQKKHDAEKHLERCDKCQADYARFAYAVSEAHEYCNYRAERHERRIGGRREAISSQVGLILHNHTSGVRVCSQWKSAYEAAPSYTHPIFGVLATVAAGLIVCISLWWPHSKPAMTPNVLLMRAAAWDPSMANHPSAGVVRQLVRIKAPGLVVQRTIYRDAQGERSAKQQNLADNEKHIKDDLAAADVIWDEPLSASSYREWRDQQPVRQDEITRIGQHLLVLTTTAPEGRVAAESLTMRDTDFHPVGRTVAFRDSETVEIAELDYEVLPWAAVRADRFNPPGTPRVADSEFLPVPHAAARPTEGQLDLAELSARLVLNGLHADTGEQIQVIKNADGIEVRGIVDNEERKGELHRQLMELSNVKDSIVSVEALQKNAGGEEILASSMTTSVSVQPTPLAKYVTAKGGSVDVLDHQSRDLLSGALTVSQESRALTGLLNEFAAKGGLNYLSRAMLEELVFSHRTKLLLALQQERHVLDATNGPADRRELKQETPHAPADALDALLSDADRNLKLCEELTTDGNLNSRSAKTIAAELAVTANQLYIGAHETRLVVQSTPQPAAGLAEKK
jgi:hypothetical protein